MARRTVVDVSMLSTWNHECRSYIVFCISIVAPRTVLDVSMLTTCYYSYYVVLHSYCVVLVEGSLNSKLPTIWTVEKQMRQAVKSEGRRCTSAKVRRKKIHLREMLEKSRNAVCFQWFVCRVSRKVGLLKRRVRR